MDRLSIMVVAQRWVQLGGHHIAMVPLPMGLNKAVNNLLVLKRRECSEMIHWLTINNHPRNPQQPIHSLRKTYQYDNYGITIPYYYNTRLSYYNNLTYYIYISSIYMMVSSGHQSGSFWVSSGPLVDDLPCWRMYRNAPKKGGPKKKKFLQDVSSMMFPMISIFPTLLSIWWLLQLILIVEKHSWATKLGRSTHL